MYRPPTIQGAQEELEEGVEQRRRSRRAAFLWDWLLVVLAVLMVAWSSLLVLQEFVEVLQQLGACL